ncbi:MAG: hypothetical protein R2849_03860 [Thermomicrobiales bacterium]
MDYPSPAQGDWEYQGVQSVGGMNMHQFSYGNYTVMVQDGQGIDRTVYVNDHATGSSVDAGYILRANGAVEVHPDWAVAEQDAPPAEEPEEPEAAGEPGEDEIVETDGTARAEVEAADEDPEADGDDLEFLTEEEPQSAETESPDGESGEDEPLTFNGPETGVEETLPVETAAENGSTEETIEPVEIAQPEIVEPEDDLEPVTAAAVEEDDAFADDSFDDDDDDDGTGL